MAKTKKYYPYQVPQHIFDKLEVMAKQIRKQTGKNVTWSRLVREALENFLKNK